MTYALSTLAGLSLLAVTTACLPDADTNVDSPTQAPIAESDQGPYEGMHACNREWSKEVFWLGKQNGMDWIQRIDIMSPDDHPTGSELRNAEGQRYTTRGGFDTMLSEVDFDGQTLVYRDVRCVKVSTLREMLDALDLDADALVQETVDVHGLLLEEVASRMDDPAFARTALGFDDDADGMNMDHLLSDVLNGRTQ